MKLFRLDIPPERVHQLAAELDTLIAAGLTHPVIASPIATGIGGASAYLGQDFVAADSLDTVLRESGPLPAAEAIRMTTKLAGALDAAAAAGIVHGALHPRDVLVSADETRLTGVGIARALERAGVSAILRRPYTAPERAGGATWDRRADVYSLAVVVHEMIWGRRLAGAGKQAAKTLTDVEGGDLAALRRVFARAVAEEPQQRFATAIAFAEALQEACPHAGDGRPTASRMPRADAPTPPLTEPQWPLDDLVLRTPSPVADEPECEVVESATMIQDEALLDRPVAPPFVRLDDASLNGEPDAGGPATEAIDDSPTIAVDGYAMSAADARDGSTTIRPLALALFLGVAIGFAGGYALGYRAQPGDMAAAISALPAAPSVAAQASSLGPAVVPREFTESAVKAPPSPVPPAGAMPAALEGRLLVRSTPAGARVFVDGREVGHTPITTRNLARGAHDVRIVRDGYAPVERRVTVTPAEPEPSLSIVLARARPATPAPVAGPAKGRGRGWLGVDSRPAGASVYVDGKLVGTTPLSLENMEAGEHAVHLERDGYRRWASSVRIVAGARNRVAASLER